MKRALSYGLLGLVSALLAAAGGCAAQQSAATTGEPTPDPSGTADPDWTPAPSTCIPAGAPGDHSYACDGITFDVRVPASCDEPGCGLILDVHGLSMSAEMEDANTRMRELGEENGYVVVQPNANPAPPFSSWSESDYDDVYAFLELAISTWSIDADRVHMLGFSQGGLMTFTFLCDHAEVLASVAPGAASGNGCSFSGGNVPSRQIPILQLHGTRDSLVSFEGAGIPQRDAIRAAWGLGAGTVVDSGAAFTHTRYTNASGGVLEFLQHDYEASSSTLRGHCYPGSDDLAGGASGQLFGFGCQGSNGFDWGEVAMAFFLAHPRP